MASPVKSDLEVWIARLPGLDLPLPVRNGYGADSTDLHGSGMAVFDHLRPDSFIQHEEFPAVLCREMTAVAAGSGGHVMARVLKANPALPWPQPPWRRRTAGARISLLVAGTVWFDIAGVGEESFSATDSWCLPASLDHTLLEASADFELLEIELPHPVGSPVAPSGIPEMLMLYGTYSYRPVPCYGKPTEHAEYPSAEPAEPGTALSVRLDDSAPNGWAGCPWHLHDQGIQCGYLASGTARMNVEGLGVVDAGPGTFWMQQAVKVPV